jgi:hypothetical protein
MTLFGNLKFHRTALLPSSRLDVEKLSVITPQKMVFPLDEALGIDTLPYKITPEAMLEIAYWVQDGHSYDSAERAIKRNTCMDVGADTIRTVANHIGKIVFEMDKLRADEAWALLNEAKVPYDLRYPHILYLEVDGAMLHTRKKKNEPGAQEAEGEKTKSAWMENKLGMVFSSDNFRWWTDKKGERRHVIGKREYITYLGAAEDFVKHFWATALRNGYGKYATTILLSDGAAWIKTMKADIFPDAQHILDYFHLCENVSNFAKAVFKNNEVEYKPWAEAMCKLLRASKHEKVLEEIKNLGKRRLSRSVFNLARYYSGG